jgi:antibiotic biosynthesis monooxygenase (ABM) superfamily enzyme
MTYGHTLPDARIYQKLQVCPLGLAHWFMTGAQHTPPPRWKVAIVTWLGIFPTVLVLFTLLGDLLSTLPLVPRVMMLTGMVVLIMTWVVAPQMTKLMKPWLHAKT